MIQNVSDLSLSQVFDIGSKTSFSVPKYQRKYAWGIKQWQTLFNDLAENSEGYFLGSIICVNASQGFSKYEVIDGQQRLLTLSLLLAALYSVLNENMEQINPNDRYRIGQIKSQLVVKTGSGTDTETSSRFVPQLQSDDYNDYLGLLAEIGVMPFKNKPKNAGNRCIFKAHRYFERCMKDRIEQDGINSGIAAAFSLQDKINSAVLVVIKVASYSDAYTLFESLNNRGVPLTAVDLIKNLLLSKLEKLDGSSSADMDGYFTRWAAIIKNLGDKYGEQERFFRQNYNAFRKSLNKPFAGDGRQYPLGTLATRSNLLDIYEKLISSDPKNMLDELFVNASIYAEITVNSDCTLTPLQEAYKDLKRVQGAPGYLLLMYFAKYRKELQLADEDIIGICRLLVSFFVRRNLTELPPTQDLSRMFMAFIEEIEEQGYAGKSIYENLRKRLVESSASDEAFAEKLRGPVYEDNIDLARFILCMLEAKYMTVEKQDLWKRKEKNKNNLFVWSIEHIFPQGENIPQTWVDMIADGDRDKARECQQKYVHTLGNLTLTGYNSALGNRSFEEKKNRLNANGSFIGFRNGLHLNEDVCDKDAWTVDMIRERTERMAKEVMEMFRM